MSFLHLFNKLFPGSKLTYGHPFKCTRLLTYNRGLTSTQCSPCVLRINMVSFHPKNFCYHFNPSLRYATPHCAVPRRLLSTDPGEQEKAIEEKKTSLMQRFKESYAIYGKVVIVIHGLTSCLWFGSAYLIACTGINLLELFEAAHFPEWICKPLRFGGGTVNTVATALVLYKLVAPLRYGLTLVLSRYYVHYLRSKGKAPQLADRNRFRNLARESAQLSKDRFKYRISKSRKAVLAFSKNAKRR